MLLLPLISGIALWLAFPPFSIFALAWVGLIPYLHFLARRPGWGRTLLGHLPPRRGEVKINGKLMTGAEPHLIARQGIAYVPEGRGIFPNLTVKENLVMAKNQWALRIVPEVTQRGNGLATYVLYNLPAPR